ncbi:inosine/xanthosine triphosphatase [Nitzschia inconspicua]|uniref:Inosine/xanthosine triphosphatase n=1 Tax=Nitzschia inconspicua TaxID=303405 RepID=A0A9K3L1W5_9STRA|nr:inosine/xanthosine triphosphatase [Nitzschia inconspicua]
MSENSKKPADSGSNEALSVIPQEAQLSSVSDDKEDGKAKNILRIAVGTVNPCKLDAVKKAVEKAINLSASTHKVELHLEGFQVESGVTDQPFGDEETLSGAKNRARNAYLAFRAAHGCFPHLSFGLEGGLEWSSHILDQEDEDTLWCMAWMAVYGKRKAMVVDLFASTQSKFYTADKEPIFGLAKTAAFMLPSTLTILIKQGMELGDADDKVFGRNKSKHGSGTVGLLTDGMIDRSAYYEHALTLALVSWIRPDIYSGKTSSFMGSLVCSSSK